MDIDGVTLIIRDVLAMLCFSTPNVFASSAVHSFHCLKVSLGVCDAMTINGDCQITIDDML